MVSSSDSEACVSRQANPTLSKREALRFWRSMEQTYKLRHTVTRQMEIEPGTFVRLTPPPCSTCLNYQVPNQNSWWLFSSPKRQKLDAPAPFVRLQSASKLCNLMQAPGLLQERKVLRVLLARPELPEFTRNRLISGVTGFWLR